jgi:hypothetical protein
MLILYSKHGTSHRPKKRPSEFASPVRSRIDCWRFWAVRSVASEHFNQLNHCDELDARFARPAGSSAAALALLRTAGAPATPQLRK